LLHERKAGYSKAHYADAVFSFVTCVKGAYVFLLEFLKRAVPADDQVTRSFIDQMVSALVERYVTLSAKGGEHQEDSWLDEETKRKFEANADQSMLSHQLNGLFPSLRLMYVLELEGLRTFSDIERRVYILSYLMHDVDKMKQGLRRILTRDRAAIDAAKTIITDELEQCRVQQFFPEFAAYMEDITFLVVNTQQVWGTNLTTFLWRFELAEARLSLLRRFCTYSDQIAYAVTSPATILEASGLKTILADLGKDELVFSYHQLREVRGLFTGVVNNGMVHLFTSGGQREGIWPYLFFSDGVVYIARKSLHMTITMEDIVGAVKEQLQAACATRIKNDAPGFKFSIQGIAKHPEYYFEFLSLEEYLDLLARFTIIRTTNDVTSTPLDKLRQMQLNGEIAADLPMDFAPDVRTSMVSRFFSVVFATVLAMLDKTQDALRKRVEQEVVNALGIQPYWERSKTIPNKGGVDYRWFWLGACYLRDHPGITAYEGEGNLRDTFYATFTLILKLAAKELSQQMQARQRYLGYLLGYLESIVEVPQVLRPGGALPNFHGEIEGYMSAKGKSKGRKLICTLCNSAYPTEEQADNAVLFQPWVYKNKLPLYAGTNAGGVCAICALELMLRQLLQKGQLRLTGSKFEAMKTKYIAVYPNYFFTAETGSMVQEVLNQLRNINFFLVRRQLAGKEVTVGDVLTLDVFEPPPEEAKPDLQVIDLDKMMEGDDIDLGDAVDEEATSEQKSSIPESNYIKYEYPTGSYPSMGFFGMRAGKDDNDTASWAMPALLALALPLVTGAKVVISEMLLPLFSSGHDFLETIVFDAPHPYLGRLLDGVGAHKNRVRVNKVLEKLSLLTNIYQVNIETHAERGRPEWKHLSGIVRNIETDPMYVFSYLREQERRGRPFASGTEDYIGIYRRVCKEILGTAICRKLLDMKLKEEPDMDSEEDLGNIQHCVDRYVKFYRVYGDESYSILRPIDIVAKAIINSPFENFNKKDLFWQIQGEMKSWLDRVRSRQAKGRAVFWKKEDIETEEADAIYDFISYFYEHVFVDYCQEERGILRSRINRFKDGCEAYYTQWRRANRALEKQAQQQEEEQDTEKEPVA